MKVIAYKLLRGFAIFIFILFLAYSVFFSFKTISFSNQSLKFKLVSFLRYSSIKPGFLKFIDLNFNTLFSDYFWTLFVQEVSSARLARMRYPYMYKISAITVSLNPNFNYAYQAGGTLLGLSGKPKRAIKLLKMGMEHLKGNWNIPFLIAFNYFYSLNNYRKAAYYLRYAVKMKGSPKYLEFLYMKLLNKSGNLKKTLSFLRDMYKNNKNPYIRQIIKYRINAVKNEVKLTKEHKAYKIPYSLKLFLQHKTS
ncbi:MAG: tetratricopeptide repeat protein [bacterium]